VKTGGDVVSGSVCRLSVQAGEGHAVDLVLPRTPPVAALLPTIVDLAGAEPGGWRLSRPDGRHVDDSISLQQNMIEDGDLLLLTTDEPPPLPPRQPDVFELTAATAAAPSSELSSPIPRVLFLWSVISTAAVACAHGGARSGAVCAALGCVGSLAAAHATDRTDRSVSWVLCGAAIVFGVAAGFLAVPSPPSAPNVLLAAAAGSAVACAVLRLHRWALVLGAATVSLGVPVALTAAIATVHPVLPTPAGAVLSALALTVLSAAPRLAVIATGLAPDVAEPQRAARAHSILTGVVLGSSSAVALGAALVAIGGPHRCAPILGWLLAAAMLLRVTSYIDAARRWALTITGSLCITAAFTVSIRSIPSSAPWLSLALLAAGFAVLHAGPPTDTTERLMARAEIVALVLVIPTALWVADVYTVVRGG
jgi:type VII secretion integral membrane protein EccD